MGGYWPCWKTLRPRSSKHDGGKEMTYPLKTGKILVVDDVPANLKLISEILSGQGYRVRPTSSGTMALRSVEV